MTSARTLRVGYRSEFRRAGSHRSADLGVWVLRDVSVQQPYHERETLLFCHLLISDRRFVRDPVDRIYSAVPRVLDIFLEPIQFVLVAYPNLTSALSHRPFFVLLLTTAQIFS